jgi:hypothetical protein
MRNGHIGGRIPHEATQMRCWTSHLRRLHLARVGAGVLLVFSVVGLLSACTSVAAPPEATRQFTPIPPEPVPTSTPASNLALTHIKIYFSQFPTSTESNFSAVFPVDRIVTTKQVETYSIQLLIAGPTPEERQAGYFSELNSILSGPSSCSAPYPTGGPDFTLVIGRRGEIAQPLAATLRFCRATNSPGVGADARIIAEMTATLAQFATIQHVIILTQDGHCFGDESGQDRCLRP